MKPLRVALLGCGTVGSAVLRLVSEQADDLTARIGRPVEVAGIAVRRPAHHTDVPAGLLTTDALGLVTRDESTRTHVYEARLSRDETQRQLVSDLVDRAFGGSAAALVMQALNAHSTSPQELKEIEEVIEDYKEGLK